MIEMLQFEAKVHKSLIFLPSELEDKDLNLIIAVIKRCVVTQQCTVLYIAVKVETYLRLHLGLHFSTLIESDA